MMELLEFTFQDLPHFVGMCILLTIVGFFSVMMLLMTGGIIEEINKKKNDI